MKYWQRRVKYPYWEWEDFHAGLYGVTWAGEQEHARQLLADPAALEIAMRSVVQTWPNATAHHLTDDDLNGRAWLGWAACGIASQVPAHLTRAAWWQLSETERVAANGVADRVMKAYCDAHQSPTLF